MTTNVVNTATVKRFMFVVPFLSFFV